MAKPKVFISSTYYDMRYVRADLERFIADMGYDPVLNEKGSIPYGKDKKLEQYCYDEIVVVDIVVSIIGGRFGSKSANSHHSISQVELKTAIEQNKQVYIFIEKSVYTEFKFFQRNKDVPGVTYNSVDDIAIFNFIETVEALPNNNTIHSFEASNDIVVFLREQWAGLFQRFLQEQGRLKELGTIKRLEITANTLDQLVTFLTEEKKGSESVINEILLSNHPAMMQVKRLLNIPYRVYFSNYDELNQLLRARQYYAVQNTHIVAEDIFQDDEIYHEWNKVNDGILYVFRVNTKLFNPDMKLKVITNQNWNESYISSFESQMPPDDLPF